MIERILRKFGFVQINSIPKTSNNQIENEIKLINTIDKLRNELFDWRKSCFEHEIYSPKELKEILRTLKNGETSK